MNISFIGLGIMGSRMAAHLQQRGHTLSVYNRSPEKAHTLLAGGARWAETPADIAADSEVIITMLAHPEAVSEAALGEDGFLQRMTSGSLWIDTSTVHPGCSRQLAAAAHARDVRFLDAPVAGSKDQAQAAQLVFFVGGQADDIARAQPLFEAMGRRALHVGTHGMGSALKLVVNHLLATSMAAFVEGMVFGQALGLTPELLFEVLLGGAVTPPYLNSKREKLEHGSYEADFPLKWMHKDTQLVTTTAADVGVATPLAELTQAVYQRALAAGLGEQDFSALYGYLQGDAVKRDT